MGALLVLRALPAFSSVETVSVAAPHGPVVAVPDVPTAETDLLPGVGARPTGGISRQPGTRGPRPERPGLRAGTTRLQGYSRLGQVAHAGVAELADALGLGPSLLGGGGSTPLARTGPHSMWMSTAWMALPP